MYGVGLFVGIRFLSSFMHIDPLVQSRNICSRRQPKFSLFRKEYWLNSTSDDHSFVEFHTLRGMRKYRLVSPLLWMVTVYVYRPPTPQSVN
jgi:hypothetical protein